MTTPYWSDFVPNSTFYRILSGFHRTFATGVAADRGRLLLQTTGPVPLGFAYVILAETNPFYELVITFPDYALRISLGNFSILLLNFLYYFVWLRITEEGSVPEMRIWSTLLIMSDWKWCIHLSRSLFSYFNYLVSVTAGRPRSPRGHMYPSFTVDFGWFVAFESIRIVRVKIDWNCHFVGLLHRPIWL